MPSITVPTVSTTFCVVRAKTSDVLQGGEGRLLGGMGKGRALPVECS
jgi:hypothetical protein